MPDAEERGWMALESEVLGEVVVVAASAEAVREALKEHPDAVWYGRSEVLRLAKEPRLDDAALRLLHKAKRILKATVIGKV